MTRDELIELGKKIVNVEGSEEEIDDMIEIFGKNVPHPNGANLFYWPEDFNSRKDNIGAYSPTVEEVVDKCLAYKPTLL